MISFINDNSGLSLSIEDNGIGFNRADAHTDNGLGLKSIKTRAAYLKANYEVDTQPGKGVLISIHIPKEKLSNIKSDNYD